MIKSISKPKLKLGINKKLEEIRKDFYNLRLTFSKEEVDKYRKVFYIKNYRYLSESEISEEYLNMIRPYLRDLINEHIPTMELNNRNNNSNNNSKNSNNNNDNNNNNNDNETDHAEWKIQLTVRNSCISAKSFEDKCDKYTKSEPVEIYMGSHTENVIDTLFNTLLQRFQHAQETSNERGVEFIPNSVELLYYHFQRH